MVLMTDDGWRMVLSGLEKMTDDGWLSGLEKCQGPIAPCLRKENGLTGNLMRFVGGIT